MAKINGKRIAELRKKSNMSQREFANRICTSQQMISFVESGARQASLDILQRIAAYFNCSIDDLVINPNQEDTA